MGLACLFMTVAAASGLPRPLVPAVFLSLSMVLSAILVGGYAELERGRNVARFQPDQQLRSSIFSSFRNAPRAFQLFLHGAAVKDCKPYAWSYRQMDFYELPANVAVNVLPARWIEDCKIQRLP